MSPLRPPAAETATGPPVPAGGPSRPPETATAPHRYSPSSSACQAPQAPAVEAVTPWFALFVCHRVFSVVANVGAFSPNWEEIYTLVKLVQTNVVGQKLSEFLDLLIPWGSRGGIEIVFSPAKHIKSKTFSFRYMYLMTLWKRVNGVQK